MQSRVTLLVLAALCGAAMAREPPMSPAGRELLQTPDDCARSIPNCKTCRYQKFGTTTLTVCSQCGVGYTVKSGGRACWCAPGYKSAIDGAGVVTCSACGGNNYCEGSKASATSTPIACGTHKQTVSTVAKSGRECVADPGYSWVATGAATICDAGSYNPGMNNRVCTKCPGGLTTAAQGSASASACVAPPGSYYYRGKAVACAQGFWKSATSNADCTPCPLGFTTSLVAQTAGTACTVLKAGYSAPAGGTIGTTPGALCDRDTFRSGTATYSGAAITCNACPTGCETYNVTGATGSTLCLTPAGFGWNSGPSTCTACTGNTYNAGYNRETCTACPSGFTAADGSVSGDACMVAAGAGTTRSASGVLTAAACPYGTYGRPTGTYGLVDVECTKCIDNTNTTGTGKTLATECLTNPGYGYDDGAANECDYGYWSAGGDQAPCIYCGDGKNTSNPSAATIPVTGAQAIGWCVSAAGWSAASGSLNPCIKGTYKSLLGDSACVSCNTTGGLTTSLPYGATSRTDCDACMPGYGNSGGAFSDLTSNTCTQCASGYYSTGGAQGGAACDSCPTTDTSYTGAYVSKLGATTSDSCIREFPSNGDQLNNTLEWDIIPMAAASLSVQGGSNTPAACQTGCTAAAFCQYFVYYNYTTSGTRCYYRTSTDLTPITAAQLDSPSGSFFVAFEVKDGQYVIYSAVAGDAYTIGNNITITYTTYTAAKSACDADASCAGFNNMGNALWRTFAGVKWAEAVGKVHAVGANIMSWVN